MASMEIFNRKHKQLQRDRAASAIDSKNFDFLREEIAYRLVDRLNV
jgi:hypothetical protein